MATRKLTVLALGAVLLAGAGGQAAMGKTPKAPAQPRQCFWAHSVNGFSAPDDRTVYVNVGVKEVWKLDLIGPCRDVDWASRIGIQARGGGSSICSGFDAELIVPNSTIGPQRCQVRQVTKLTPEEVEAMKHRKRH